MSMMIRQSLKGKIILPSVIILVFLVAFLTAYSSYEFIHFTSSVANENIAIIAKHLNNYLEQYEGHTKAAAVSTSVFSEVRKAVSERDRGEIIRILDPMTELFEVTYFTVTDADGIVLARTYEPGRFGDIVSYVKNIEDAMQGKVSTYYESGPVIKVSVHTGAPVYDDNGRLAGIISAGVRLDENDGIDRLKDLFNAEFSVFYGNTRIATTLKKDGERLEGIQNNADVARMVIENRKEYFGNSEVLGVSYNTFWRPLINAQNEVFAMLVTGVADTELVHATNGLIISCTLIGMIGLALSMTVLLYIITKIIRPVNNLVRLVSDVTQGNINVNIDRTLVPKDEIGFLISDVYSLIEVFRSMLGDLSHLTQELRVSGDIEFQIDTGKYSGYYKEIIDGIKALGNSISMKNKTMAVIDFLDTMITVTDFDYNILYLNQHIIDVYDIDRENCFGQKCYKIIRKYDKPCSFCRMQDIVENKEAYPSTEYRYIWDDCIGRWIGGKSSIIRWVDGSEVFCSFYKDETQVKSYEAQLKDALQKAQMASVAKSAFLANMSHEIRTPMNSIMGFTELALDNNISDETKDYLRKIMINTEGLLQIINDVLDISKVEAGRMDLEKIPFDLNDIFAHCRTVINQKADEKGIKLNFYAEPSIRKRLLGDPTKLRQVLINLLSNAVKFTNVGVVELTSNIESFSEGSVVIYFEVKDSGIGMTEEQISGIFEPFMQGDSSTTRKYGGTGLGLSITKNLVELMGGKLNVESMPGVGSKFSFFLSFNTVDMLVTEEEKEPEKIEKPVFDGEALVCEDNSMNQLVINESLSRVGLKVVIAENGRDGVNLVRERIEKKQKLFDIIFMDVHMPIMDGLEAASIINKLNAEIPIVAMTANVMSGDKEMYRSKGMCDFVGKPFTSVELWKCLLKYLKPLNIPSAPREISVKKEDILLDADLEFKKILQANFLKNSREKAAEIENALETHDLMLAYRLAHTLKGNAAQLDQNSLRSAAAAVEQALKDGQNLVTAEQMNLLKTELNKTLEELSLWRN